MKDSELKSFHEAFKKQKKETKIKILELKMCIKFLNTIKYVSLPTNTNKRHAIKTNFVFCVNSTNKDGNREIITILFDLYLQLVKPASSGDK